MSLPRDATRGPEPKRPSEMEVEMVKSWLVAALAASLLVAGPLAAVAPAQDSSSSTAPSAPQMKKSKPVAHHAKPAAAEETAMAAGGDMPYPPCSSARRDRCIELNQPGLHRA